MSVWIVTEDGILSGAGTETGATFDGGIRLWVVPDDRRVPGIETIPSQKQAAGLIEDLRDAIREAAEEVRERMIKEQERDSRDGMVLDDIKP